MDDRNFFLNKYTPRTEIFNFDNGLIRLIKRYFKEFNTTQIKILIILSSKKNMSYNVLELSKMINKKRDTIQKNIKTLFSNKYIQREKQTLYKNFKYLYMCNINFNLFYELKILIDYNHKKELEQINIYLNLN